MLATSNDFPCLFIFRIALPVAQVRAIDQTPYLSPHSFFIPPLAIEREILFLVFFSFLAFNHVSPVPILFLRIEQVWFSLWNTCQAEGRSLHGDSIFPFQGVFFPLVECRDERNRLFQHQATFGNFWSIVPPPFFFFIPHGVRPFTNYSNALLRRLPSVLLAPPLANLF